MIPQALQEIFRLVERMPKKEFLLKMSMMVGGWGRATVGGETAYLFEAYLRWPATAEPRGDK